MKQAVIDLLMHAGITVNGSAPWDITVHSDQFYKRVLANAELEIGNTYVEGLWDCQALDQFFAKVMRADLEKIILSHPAFWKSALIQKLFEGLRRFFNYQTQKKSTFVGKRHYDIGNDLYSSMLGKNMVYTCGYWEHAHNLDAAQEAKLELTCQKLKLKPGMKVLDIGCGWGSFAKYAAENYHVSVVGITISKAQMQHAQILTKQLPVEIRFQDYRDLLHTSERFDRIVSLGMFEHVGYKNYSNYMKVAAHCLKEEGLFLLHTIGRNTSTPVCASQWINTHIFPNGHIPSITQIGQSLENTLVMEDWHNFGTHYDKTLMSWHHNFHAGWDSLKKRYGAQFYRLWNYYLLSCAGSFRSRHNQLWQIVLSSKGLLPGYTRVDTLTSPKNIWEPTPI